MIHPPNQFVPGPMTVHNGDPTRSADIRHVDTYTAYLAATHKTLSPVRVGDFVSGLTGPAFSNTYKWTELVPAYTLWQGFKIWYLGWGKITITNDVDSYNTSLELWNDLAAPTNVRYIDMMAPNTATANGQSRALKVNATTAPKIVTYTMVLSAPLLMWADYEEYEEPDLKIKTLQVVSLPAADDYTLP